MFGGRPISRRPACVCSTAEKPLFEPHCAAFVPPRLCRHRYGAAAGPPRPPSSAFFCRVSLSRLCCAISWAQARRARTPSYAPGPFLLPRSFPVLLPLPFLFLHRPARPPPFLKLFFFTPLLFRHHGHRQHCLSCWLCRCRPPLAAIRAHPPRQPDLVGRRPGGGRGGYRRRRHPRRVLGVRQPPPRVACGRRWLWVPPPPHVPGDSGVVCVAGRPEAAPLLL